MLGMTKMKTELNEHRHRLEQSVESRTEQLLKRIALLESCNATLSGRLALAHKELAAHKQQPPHILPKKDTEPDDRTAKLYIMNNQAQKPVLSNTQNKEEEHAVAA